ncbi:hypothetical protein G6L28_02055 [Agrobacterium larrymoorei]|uniref:hypothetical protein n=1 Tax=Agrobacterium larrymoorei TaxID=160699 RepID=UPI001571D7C3|nr:hypothetical protein [Agrobacterium larrymoorei]NTJ41380.1 hypothetical protein [Agrobacterium larrymoorei]
MIKLLATGLWILVMTLGGVYAAAKFGGGSAQSEVAAAPPSQFIQSETVTLPVLSDGAVAGYFLVRSTLVVDEELLKQVHEPVPVFLTDELYTLLVGDKIVDIKDTNQFDVAGFKAKIRDGLNTRLGKPLVKDVLVEQMDYITKDDIEARDPNRQPQHIVANTDAPPPKAASGSSH